MTRGEKGVVFGIVVNAVLGLPFAVGGFFVFWVVDWGEKWGGVLVVLMSSVLLEYAVVHIRLLRRPPSATWVEGHTLQILAAPLLSAPLQLDEESVERVYWCKDGYSWDSGMALLCSPWTRPNLIVELRDPRKLPVGRILPQLMQFLGSGLFGNIGTNPVRRKRYKRLGLHVRDGCAPEGVEGDRTSW